jgi:putative ABC transport system permease protein
MLTSLDRKLVRDLTQRLGQVTMIALVVSAGVATFINSRTMLFSLENTRAAFYERHNFANVFASLKRAPDALAERLAEIPGVQRVETRIVEGVNLDVPGLDEPAVGQIISLPVNRRPLVNQIYLRRGRWLAPGRSDEVLVIEKFVQENKLDLGDKVTAIINGRRKDLQIVGVVLSPEYVFQMKPGDMVPDAKHFGVFWMDHEALSMAFDMEGAFNHAAATLMRGASEADVIQRFDQLLDPYGGTGAYGRRDQLSHLLLESDIQGLRSTGLIAPTIFLGVAAFLLNVVLARLLSLQRDQIAALKAFGYSNTAIGWHYIKFVLLIVIVGSVLGSLMGARLGYIFTEMIARVYQYPELLIQVRPSVIASAVSVAGGASILGALGAVVRAVRVPPAEAMRPEPPSSYGPTILERLGFGRFLPAVARMVLRHLERRPVKTSVSILAIGLSIGIVVVGNFIEDAIDFVLHTQFHRVQQYDMAVTSVEPLSTDVAYELANMPGVMEAQPMRTVSTRIRSGHRTRRVGLTGLPVGGDLQRLIDHHGSVYPMPPGGLVVSRKLAEVLSIKVGDTLRVEVLEDKRPVLNLPVVSLLEDVQGLNAYLSLDELNRAMKQGPRASGVLLTVDPAKRTDVYHALKQIPKLAGVTVKDNAIESFKNTLAKNLGEMKKINLFFAIVIAVGVVYNGAQISLSERSRELATLRVIGFTRGEISAILLGELGTMTLIAVPIGIIMGYWFSAFLALFMDQEVFRFPLIIERSTFGMAVSVVLAASVVSGLIVRRELDHLDLIAVLKSRE